MQAFRGALDAKGLKIGTEYALNGTLAHALQWRDKGIDQVQCMGKIYNLLTPRWKIVSKRNARCIPPSVRETSPTSFLNVTGGQSMNNT